VHHVVTKIVAPMGPPLSERPPLPADAERLAAVEAKRAAKDERKAANGRWINAQRVAQRKREQDMAEKVAMREAMNQWVEEKRELVTKAKVLREAKMETRQSLQKVHAAKEQRRLANIADMEVLQKEKLARLERHLDRLEKTLQDPNTPTEVKERLEKRKPWLFVALERCKASAASRISAKTSTDPIVPAAPRSTTKEPAISLEALLDSTEERLGTAKAQIFDMEQNSSTTVDATQTVKSLEQKANRIRAYLQTVKGNEQEFASKALKWQVLVDELHMVSEEKTLAVNALASLPGISFGSHIRKWNSERIAADKAKRGARWDAQTSEQGVPSGARTVEVKSRANPQNTNTKEATTKEESKDGKPGAISGWFKW
jgi:hypothetical protein